MALPVTEVHAIRPPPLPREYDKLSELAKHCKCVFRVWEATSTSPLIWTGHTDNSGFNCPNANLAGLSPKSYLRIYKDFRGSVDWAEGPYMKQTVVDHILKKARHTALCYPGMVMDEPGYDVPTDEMTCWISTSKNLFWCIWDIARRLAMANSPLPDTDPDGPNGLDPYNSVTKKRPKTDHVVHLALIRHHSGTIGLSDARRGYLELHIDPKGPTGRVIKEDMSVSLQGDYETARRSAINSDEVLYYGRIFTQNIDSSLEFTAQNTPFPLPDEFFRKDRKPRQASPDSNDSRALSGWLDDLVWDPLRDDYLTAKSLVERRKGRSLPSAWSARMAEKARDDGSRRGAGRVEDWRDGIRSRGKGRGGFTSGGRTTVQGQDDGW